MTEKPNLPRGVARLQQDASARAALSAMAAFETSGATAILEAFNRDVAESVRRVTVPVFESLQTMATASAMFSQLQADQVRAATAAIEKVVDMSGAVEAARRILEMPAFQTAALRVEHAYGDVVPNLDAAIADLAPAVQDAVGSEVAGRDPILAVLVLLYLSAVLAVASAVVARDIDRITQMLGIAATTALAIDQREKSRCAESGTDK